MSWNNSYPYVNGNCQTTPTVIVVNTVPNNNWNNNCGPCSNNNWNNTNWNGAGCCSYNNWHGTNWSPNWSSNWSSNWNNNCGSCNRR